MEQLSLFENQKKSTDWKWWFKDYPTEKNGLTVFSFFSGGGGSTMGYKLAGCDVLGNCEIDKNMTSLYKRILQEVILWLNMHISLRCTHQWSRR